MHFGWDQFELNCSIIEAKNEILEFVDKFYLYRNTDYMELSLKNIKLMDLMIILIFIIYSALL